MRFAIITQAAHKLNNNRLTAYAPYVREMNLWLKYTDTTKIVAPLTHDKPTEIEAAYLDTDIEFIPVKSFDIISLVSTLHSIVKIPRVLFKIYKTMQWADHIHLRCPGNMGLLASCVQMLFPKKMKTVKYAGNWDPKSKQPWSYEWQKWILQNTFLTKNCKVLVYGEWPNQSKNIQSFFTASYNKNEIVPVEKESFSKTIKLIYVGGFTKGKQPMLSVKAAQKLLLKKYQIELDMFGEGPLFKEVKEYIKTNKLSDHIILHGNQSKDKVKAAYQKSHFLIFVSKSEGWPKVVAEAMFWSCLPISSHVSCVPYMLDYGNRGAIVSNSIEEITQVIETFIKDKKVYETKVLNAKEWSQQYTLEKFENEIKQFI